MLKVITSNKVQAMSRLTIEVTNEQHQRIKVMAAMQGQSIKDYVIDRVLADEEREEQAAWEQLKTLLADRVDDARKRGTSPKTVQEITENALQSLGKA